MRRLALFVTAAVAGLAIAAPAAEAQSRKKKRSETVVVVKQRSFLDAGTQALPGSYQKYSTGMTPWRPADSIVPTGSIQRNLLPGPYGPFQY